MSDEIGLVRDDEGQPAPAGRARLLIPMQVGDATLYVEAVGDEPEVVESDDVRAVAFTPADAFASANEALRECVRVVGTRLADLGDALPPDTVTVEFTMTFDVEGKAHIVPVLLTGKAKTGVGLKVTAQWNLGKGAAS